MACVDGHLLTQEVRKSSAFSFEEWCFEHVLFIRNN